MKKAFFITYPGLISENGINPNSTKEEHYQSRNDDLAKGKGLLTVMKQFTPSGIVKSAILRITSLGIFEAKLNGIRIGRGEIYDELAPLWTDYRHRVFEFEYDITQYLKKDGKNIFSARVSSGWWSGRISRGFYGYKPTALCAEIEITYRNGKKELIPSGEDWLATVAGPVLSADIYDGEYFDARITDPAENPDSVKWKNAELFTDYTCKIHSFEGEYVRVNEYLAPISATVWRTTKKNGSIYGEIKTIKKAVGDNCEQLLLKAGQHLTLDFGQNMVGRPALAIRADDGTEIKCLFAEMLNDSGEENRGNDGPKGSIYIRNYRSALSRLNYIAASTGIRRQLNIFKPLHTFYGFRYMEITASRDIEVKCITGEVIGSCLEKTGSFECSNPEINKLYSNIEWSMRGNYLSVPTDCPQRDERLGWTGDTQIFCGAASYIADTKAFLSKWLSDARDSQIGCNGAYSDVVPRLFGEGNAAWADAGILVPYRLWKMFGDVDVLAKNYDSMEAYMQYLEGFGLDGPKQAYGDWLNYEETSKDYISICYYAYDTMLMAEISELLDKPQRKNHYSELYRKIIAHFKEKYVSENEILEKTQTGYLLPLYFDMLDGEIYKNTVKSLEKKIIDNNYTLSTGFVGTGILCQTLSKVGLNNLAYSLVLNTSQPSWLYCVRLGATTVWERWNSYTKEKGFGNAEMNSFNHYAYGAVAEWFYSSMAGIRPSSEAAGFSDGFVLSPCPDTRTDDDIPEGQSRITMVHATYRDIDSRWEYENNRFVWRFTIPDRFGWANIEFPLLYGQKSIEINGLSFTADELDGKIENGKMCFVLTTGKYTIK